MNAPLDPHDGFEEQAALEALGLLEEPERAQYLSHRLGCQHCQVLEQGNRTALMALAHSAPEMEPSEGFRERLLARADLERRAGERGLTALPSVPDRGGGTPGEQPRLLRFPTWRTAARRWASAAILIGTLGLGAAVGRQAYEDQVVATVPLAGPTLQGNATVRVRRGGSAELELQALASPPAGKVYQAWVIDPGSAPQPAGTLDTGSGAIRLTRDTRGRIVAVTLEPGPGSLAPTTEPFALAQVPA